MAQLLFPSLGDSANKATSQALTTNTSGTTSGQKDSASSSTTNESGSSTTNASNMDPQSLAALNLLIKQLLGGGTQQMANDEAVRRGEINSVQAQRAGYSKDAAFGDAQGLIAQTLRQAMEKMLPSITRAAEGAGTSGNAMRALLMQDAQTRAAESASAAGVNAAIGYGNVAGNMNNTLEALTRPQDAATNALLNALQIAKGAVTNSTTNTSGTRNTVGTGSETSSGTTNEVRTVAPTITTGQAPASGMQYFGPVNNPDADRAAANNYLTSALYQLNGNQTYDNLKF